MYSNEIRNKVMTEIKNGKTIKEVSEEMHISKPTIYKWLKEVNKENTSKEIEDKEDEIDQECKEISKQIKQLIADKKYEEAKELGKRYKDNEVIQSQMITIAIKEKDYETAKKIGEKFKDNEVIQSQMITIAIKEKDYETVKKIVERFKDYKPIQSQISSYIKRLIFYNKHETISEFIEIFRDSKIVMSEIEKYNPFYNQLVQKINNSEEDNKKSKYLSEIKTKIYCNKIDDNLIEEINESEILSEYEKTIILLAICEKNNMPKRAKQIASESNIKDRTQKGKINKIVEKINSKKKRIFDLGKYDDILEWEFDNELLNKYEEENKTRLKQKEEGKIVNNMDKGLETINQKKSKEVKYERKPVVIKSDEKHVKRIKQESKENKEKIDTNKRNIILDYLREKRIEVYMRTETTDIEARKKAIDQLDKMQYLIEKVEKEKEDSEYISYMYEKVETLKEIEKRQKEKAKQQEEAR